MGMLKLEADQWNLVYNIFSFGLISMLACTVYTLVSQARVLPKYRNALVMSSMVTFICAHHDLPRCALPLPQLQDDANQKPDARF